MLVGLASKKVGERSSFKGIIHRLDAGTIDVIVPQIVLGEAVAIITRDDPEDAPQLIQNVLGSIRDLVSPESSMPPVTAPVSRIAIKMSRDLKMDFTDALILAHALNDPHSTYLLTADRKMLSDQVVEFEENMRSNGKRGRKLRIAEHFGHG